MRYINDLLLFVMKKEGNDPQKKKKKEQNPSLNNGNLASFTREMYLATNKTLQGHDSNVFKLSSITQALE